MNKLLGLIGAAWNALEGLRAACLRHYWLGRLGSAGRGVSIGRHVRFHGARHIRVGDDVAIADFVVLRALTLYPWTRPPQTFSPELEIKRGCFINNHTQIACARRVVIGEDVMIADRCFISDHQHTYADPEMSVKAQPLALPGELVIGDGSWIGTNSSVLGAVRIGRHCVVGANSVVTRDLPDFSVAVGAPARIIRRYDVEAKTWRDTSPAGAFPA